MDNVVKLRGETDVQGTDAVAAVVAFLRSQADAIESGEAHPVQKAVLICYESVGEQFRTTEAYCNASTVERIGMIYMALHDTASVD